MPGPAEDRASRRSRRLGVLFWISAGWLIAVVACALAAPYLHLPDPTNLFPTLAGGFSHSHWLGTDAEGHDILSGVVWGARVSLLVGSLSVTTGLVVGGGAGMLAGHVRGWYDALANGVANILLAFPVLVLLIVLVSFEGQHVWVVTTGIAIVAVPIFFRIVRAATISVSTKEYVLAARALGARRARILLRDVLPNVLPSVIVVAFLGVATAIIAEGTLAYIGLSVAAPTPSWGRMIYTGLNDLEDNTGSFLLMWPLLWPSAALVLTVLACNFAGQRLQRRFDIREARI